MKMRMEEGGQAVLQWYYACKGQASEVSDSDGDEVGPPTKKKKLTSTVSTPMILAICTPIMRRAHQYVQQSRDVVFIDATSSLTGKILQYFYCQQSHQEEQYH